ncbi:MAG: MucBP domain-containing protein, partial [Clostridia bacterium]
GSKAAETYTDTLNYNEAYSVTSPVIEGYTADKLVVSGTMPADDVTVTVTYKINSYGYTVEYYYGNVKDDSKTEPYTATFGSVINKYDDKNITGYRFGHTENYPLTISTNVENNVIKVYYVKEDYNLKVNYVYEDGSKAAETYVDILNYQEPYSVTSPVIEGYTADKLVVSGTMPADDVEVTVTYKINSYNLTVNYVYEDGSKAAETYTDTLNYNETYSVTSPVIEGYTADKLVVSGTMPANDVTVTVTYKINSYDLTVNYVYEDGSKAAETYTDTLNYNETYSVTSPVIEGYTADKLVVSGTMPANDVTVTVTYKINSYDLTVNYVYEDGSKAAETYTDTLNYNEAYSVTSPVIEGYAADKLVVEGTMPASDVTVTVTYKINKFIVTYYNGSVKLGEFTESAGATHTIKDDTELTIVPPEGYVFAGTWKDDNEVVYVIGDIKTINANLNLYAQFKKIEDAESEASSFWQNKVKKYGSSDIKQYGFVGQITPVIVNGDVTNQIFYCKTTDGNIYIRNNGGIDWIKNKETNEDVDCADIIHLVKGNTYLIKENKAGLTITVVVK